MKYLIVYGTRPEQIKLQPVIDEMNERNFRFNVWNTEQHTLDGNLLKTGNTKFDKGAALSELLLVAKDFDAMVVQGDTSSALLGALAGLWLRKKVVHIEAGLRSYDDRMVEEKIRRMIDHMADLLLAPTEQSYDTLVAENVRAKIVVTGNTAIDAVKKAMQGAGRSERYVLLTMHRPENVDDKETLEQKIKAIEKIRMTLDLPLVFPIHPRTKQKIKEFKIKLPKWNVYGPISFEAMVMMEMGAKLVITDSGGIQEECCYLRKPTITIRKTTERPETIGLSNEIGDSNNEIYKAFEKVMRLELDYKTCPYGEGTAAVKIVDELWLN